MIQQNLFLLIQGITRDAICSATSSVQTYLETCRFLRYLQSDPEGVILLKKLCTEHNGIDISVDKSKNLLCVWGRTLNQRRNVLYNLKTMSTNFSLTDAKAIADARLSSLEDELRQTQRQLQITLQEKQKLLSHINLTEIFVDEITEKMDRQGLQNNKNSNPSLPNHWLSTRGYNEVRLEEGLQEWDEINSMFIATIGRRMKVSSITRIENPDLWQHYQLLMQRIPVEKKLWDGSSKESIQQICKKGFNRSYAGMHAVYMVLELISQKRQGTQHNLRIGIMLRNAI